MQIFNILIAIFWLSFWLFWIISARGVKKVVWRANTGRRYTFIIFIIIVVLFFQLPYFHLKPFSTNSIVLAIGVILCGLGLAFAIWARLHLGKNWNIEPSIQENHELVTSGPYQWVRHPIYTGMLVAFIGSSLVGNLIWVVVFIVLLLIFIMRIKTEEDFMTKLFPQQYAEYKKRTKALIPFVW